MIPDDTLAWPPARQSRNQPGPAILEVCQAHTRRNKDKKRSSRRAGDALTGQTQTYFVSIPIVPICSSFLSSSSPSDLDRSPFDTEAIRFSSAMFERGRSERKDLAAAEAGGEAESAERGAGRGKRAHRVAPKSEQSAHVHLCGADFGAKTRR